MVSGLALPTWMAVGAALTNMDENESEKSEINQNMVYDKITR